ncbi:hypothetical protein CTAM01_17322 [Colletotrichum tamarilloi]|uniref:O-methyltransferase n=1 Tax=Colletotrichum tamarilloi TaxID=1209934 RepID=A0ABQ9QFY3_9PEZI|nr:uncharacterized protein CTAM01_17322 [Colletotrichum tamarilloi]KAK1450597.1 hypothetical protein CTAM01_17322 [Colletotrichum tamarilloi]
MALVLVLRRLRRAWWTMRCGVPIANSAKRGIYASHDGVESPGAHYRRVRLLMITEASEKEGGGRVTLVDVGGGSSHEIQSICENTGLPLARCVFQDKETVISKVENRGLCRD